MKVIVGTACILMVAALPLPAAEAPDGSRLGSVTGGHFPSAQNVISRKCTRCHTAGVIDAALSARKDMVTILREMERRGASLSADERDVLGIYWKQHSPLKEKK